MGFLDIFRKKKEQAVEQKPETRSLPYKEVGMFYGKKLAPQLEEAENKTRQFQNGITLLFQSIPLQPLEKASFEKEDKRYAAMNMAKASYVTKIKSLLRSLPSTGESYGDIQQFQKQAGAIISDIQNTTPKQAAALSMFFKKESEEIVQKIKEAKTRMTEFSSFLNSKGRVMSFLSDLQEKEAILSTLFEKQQTLQSRESTLLRETNTLEGEKMNLEAELKSLQRTREWKEMESLSEDVERLERDVLSHQYKIEGELSPLKRPLKKTKHVLGGKRFDRFISSPLTAFMSENGEVRLQEILISTLTLAEEGKLSLKESEKQKLIALQEREEILKSLKEDSIALVHELEEKKRRKEGFALPKERKQKEERIKQLESSIQQMKNTARLVKKNLEHTQKKIHEQKKEIEDSIFKQTSDTITITWEEL